MKSISVVLLLMIFVGVFAQQTPPTLNNVILKINKTQKIVAWSLLSGVLILGSIGLGNASKQVAQVVLFGP